MLDHPIQLLDGVHEVLNALKSKYRLVVATKGDLLEQEKKLEKSGLLYHFHHIEIMSEKKEKDYKKLIRHLDIAPSQFLMIGNSLKSDILPCVGIGANAIHVPFHTTWVYEEVSLNSEQTKQFKSVKSLTDILTFL
mgnify:FL=1